jgi:hypothetical protein
MKGDALKIAVLMVLASSMISGCSSQKQPVVVAPTGHVIVNEPPPPLKQELVGTPPGDSYVWVQGYWTRAEGRWVWVAGHWQTRPTATATWLPGHWDRSASGWIWTPGLWQ